ncbi:V-type ATP synthase subunit A, partial [bacterium]|nr:V-type ATP synthase subunit A [bacterium]
YLQQDAFDQVDEATTADRQRYIFNFIYQHILEQKFDLIDKNKALQFFHKLRQLFRTWNCTRWERAEFKEIEDKIIQLIQERCKKEEVNG